MGHFSPQVCLTWAIMSVLAGAFCVWYLWSCEGFRCLKCDRTRSGRFQFIIIHLYISSILTLMVFSVGLAAIKYEEGFVVVGIEGTVVPRPVESWSPIHRDAFCGLTIILSFSWTLEIIIHLGELCRWLFLFSAIQSEGFWLKSKYMRAWIVGSMLVAIYMPVIVGIGCNGTVRCQAWGFIGGSIGSLLPTLGFVLVLARFPGYFQEMEARGVDQPTLLQLVKFQELSRARLAFRLVFIASFLSLGANWARENHLLAMHATWSDFLGFFGSIGYVSSSVLTLTICFPQPTSARSKLPVRTAIEKFTTSQTVASSVDCASTSIGHDQVIDIGRSFPAYEPTGRMPSFPAMVEEVSRPQASTLVYELPPIVLEPNRRRVDPEEEFGEPSSPLSARSQRLAGVFRSLSSGRKS